MWSKTVTHQLDPGIPQPAPSTGVPQPAPSPGVTLQWYWHQSHSSDAADAVIQATINLTNSKETR